jgi:uncharacterized protein (DUF4415 family)
VRKRKGIVRYTVAELKEMRRRGEDRTDDARLDTMTEEELEAAIRSDGEEEFDWGKAQIGIPEPKAQLTLRIDRDVLDWFKGQGRGYQTRMNAVLRSFVEAQRRAHR